MAVRTRNTSDEIPTANTISRMVAPARDVRGVRLVDVVLQTIASDVGGELPSAPNTARSPIHDDGNHLHVVAIAGVGNRRGTDGHGAVVSQSAGTLRCVWVVQGREIGRNETIR